MGMQFCRARQMVYNMPYKMVHSVPVKTVFFPLVPHDSLQIGSLVLKTAAILRALKVCISVGWRFVENFSVLEIRGEYGLYCTLLSGIFCQSLPPPWISMVTAAGM